MQKELAALMLQTVIIDALTGSDPVLTAPARYYLMLDRKPSRREVIRPAPTEFIGLCRVLGLDWVQMRSSLIDAAALEMVHSECYDETDPQKMDDPLRASPTAEGNKVLYFKALPVSQKSPEAHSVRARNLKVKPYH